MELLERPVEDLGAIADGRQFRPDRHPRRTKRVETNGVEATLEEDAEDSVEDRRVSRRRRPFFAVADVCGFDEVVEGFLVSLVCHKGEDEVQPLPRLQPMRSMASLGISIPSHSPDQELQL